MLGQKANANKTKSHEHINMCRYGSVGGKQALQTPHKKKMQYVDGDEDDDDDNDAESDTDDELDAWYNKRMNITNK
jgi:hypothetical protein